MVRVMGHMSTSGSASRSASGVSGRSRRERPIRRVRCTFPICDEVDISRRLKGAFDRTSRFAPGCALGTVDEVPSDGYFAVLSALGMSVRFHWKKDIHNC